MKWKIAFVTYFIKAHEVFHKAVLGVLCLLMAALSAIPFAHLRLRQIVMSQGVGAKQFCHPLLTSSLAPSSLLPGGGLNIWPQAGGRFSLPTTVYTSLMKSHVKAIAPPPPFFSGPVANLTQGFQCFQNNKHRFRINLAKWLLNVTHGWRSPGCCNSVCVTVRSLCRRRRLLAFGLCLE